MYYLLPSHYQSLSYLTCFRRFQTNCPNRNLLYSPGVLRSTMRTISGILFLLLCLAPQFASAQDRCSAALQKGSAEDLSSQFAKSVDLLILGDESTVTPQQATTMLADFFAKSGVKGYKQNHVSAAQNGKSTYSIGDLYTNNGTYRITTFFDAAKMITELRIEK